MHFSWCCVFMIVDCKYLKTNFNGHNVSIVLCFCDMLAASTLTLRDNMLQWWTKEKHVKHFEFFRTSLNRSKCIDMCGLKCQCYLWGLWFVNVDFQVYVLSMLHLKFNFFVYVSMLMFIYVYVSMVSLSFLCQCWGVCFY